MKIVFGIVIIIVLGFLGIRYFLFKIGDPVNSKVSDSYFYHYRKNLVVYSPMGNWFELDYFELEADVASFQPLNRDFGKDNKSVFWKGRKQSVDYDSFKIDASDIISDKNHVYKTNGKEYNFLGIIEDAEPKTYQLLDSSLEGYNRQNWFKDDSTVFYKGIKIKGDPKTFKPLNDAIAVDSGYIYSIIRQRGEGMELLDVDEVIQKHTLIEGKIHVINDTYVQIGNSVVSAFTKSEFTLHTFDAIKSIKAIDYFTIVVNDTLIYKGIQCPGIDIDTFESLDYGYSKDKENIYYDGKKIAGASLSDFEILSPTYGKDNKNVYYKNNVVSGANSQTFKMTSEYNVFEDGKYRYKNGKIIN